MWYMGSLNGGGGANQGQAGAGAGARDPHVTHMDMLKLLHLGIPQLTVVHSTILLDSLNGRKLSLFSQI